MRFDLWLPTANPMTTPDLLEAVGRASEARAISTLWVGEHVVLFEQYASRYPYAADGKVPAPSGSGLLEPLVTLSYLAACTETVRLGTAMLLLPQRNPVYTAKEVSTLDWLSGGRVDLGIGVGWLKEEFDALGLDFHVRGARTDAANEFALTAWPSEAERSSIRLDRRFHAGPEPLAPGDGFLWIVDYKTAGHSLQGHEEFLRNERDKYAPQLEAYARVLLTATGQSAQQLRLALYYPLLPKLLWWTPADAAMNQPAE